jgi:hypothetical protein
MSARHLAGGALVAVLAGGATWAVIHSRGVELELSDRSGACVRISAPLGRCSVTHLADGRWVVATGKDDGPAPPSPGPSPSPEPNPSPPRPVPDGRFGLAAKAAEWAKEVPQPARGKAAALAGSFRAVAAAIAAGTITSAEAIIQRTRESNVAALAEQRAAWSGWLETLRQELNGLAKSGRLKSLEDHAEAWRELATGLESIDGHE